MSADVVAPHESRLLQQASPSAMGVTVLKNLTLDDLALDDLAIPPLWCGSSEETISICSLLFLACNVTSSIAYVDAGYHVMS